jgi:hypothetical protein
MNVGQLGPTAARQIGQLLRRLSFTRCNVRAFEPLQSREELPLDSVGTASD